MTFNTLQSSSRANAPNKRILIIEDELMMSFMLDDMLTELGYDIAGTARNIDEATEQIEHQSYDAVILDVNLNGERTFNLADILKKMNMPFLFSTGYTQDSLPENYRGQPALQKPYSISQLVDHLQVLCA